MKSDKYAFAIIILNMAFLFSCNQEINTTDSQSSIDIKESKQAGVFVEEFKVSNSPKVFLETKELWEEHVWFNKIKNGRLAREQTDQTQLCFNVSNFRNPGYSQGNYLADWIMKDDSEHYVGTSNGVFRITFGGKIVPDSIKINIFRFEADRQQKYVDHFYIVKK